MLVVGGGAAGRAAARRRSEGRPASLLVDEDARRAAELPASRCWLRPARSAIYEGGLVPVDAGDVALPLPRRADRRRDGRDRAAARLPGQRPRRRDAPDGVRRLVRDFVDQARRARGRRSAPTTSALAIAERARRACGRRGRQGRRPTRAHARASSSRGAGKGRVRRLVLDGRGDRLRPRGRLGRPAAGVLAPRAGRRARRVRRRRAASSCRPTCRRASRWSARVTGEGRPRIAARARLSPARASASSASART